jgi:D-serine deaminase-like pyridoxal phosphate-dependent protein
LGLRPHAKAHKSIEIARRQLSRRGATVFCATLGEAEILGRAGIPGILVCRPVPPRRWPIVLPRCRDIDGLMIVADHADHLAALDRVAAQAGKNFSVLVDPR